ncbi:MAG: hypothetical protein JSV85_01870 [Candidatus Bathyarchaeota archaeon]|nr:MAG: hypothetical protein JSV85_01870 [Candidatus Bathyarchaeota archaeon]
MGRSAGLIVCLLGAMLFLIIVSPLAASASKIGYQIETAELTVYRDGLVHVSQALSVNEAFPSMSLELLASLVENIVVVDDENQSILDYNLDGLNMTVFSLGATGVLLEYDTDSLTGKDSGVWTLLVQNPYNLTVYLPEGSAIVYLNKMPTSIETENETITLALHPDDWEISYVLPIIGPALFRVSDLTVSPAEVEVGNEVTISLVLTNIGEEEGSYTLELKVNQVIEDTKTITLDAEASTAVQFKVVREEAGAYDVEIGELSDGFNVKELPLIPIFTVYLIVIVVLVIIGSFLVLRRMKSPSAEKIIKTHVSLRQEDKDVIRFLEDNGGKAFESEIRDRFLDIPRTSLWRLVKRLEKMEIVSVKRIGLQNQIKLRR